MPAIPLKAPSILEMGEPGTGKTRSILTLLEAGLEVFDLVLDPNGLDSILDAIRNHKDGKLLMDRFHYSVQSPSPAGFDSLMDMAKMVKNMGYEDLAKVKQGIAKPKMDSLMSMLETFQDFVCDRTEKSYGDVTTWDDTRALVIDSLSGINKIAKEHTAGFKPALHQGEWGVAMNLEEQIIFKLVSDCQCYFVVLAHIDKVVNEVTGVPQITLAALGNKLAPQLLKNFSEVVLSKRVGDRFIWSTSELNVTTKNRALPIKAELPPDFGPIILAHRARVLSVSNLQPGSTTP
jgi:hypothetical protein